MRSLMSVPLLVSALLFAGCTQQPAANTADNKPTTGQSAVAAVVNSHCPVMGGEVTEDGGTVEWNGRTVGFCCPDCIEEFEALSDEEKEAALAKADDEHQGHDHGNDSEEES